MWSTWNRKPASWMRSMVCKRCHQTFWPIFILPWVEQKSTKKNELPLLSIVWLAFLVNVVLFIFIFTRNLNVLLYYSVDCINQQKFKCWVLITWTAGLIGGFFKWLIFSFYFSLSFVSLFLSLFCVQKWNVCGQLDCNDDVAWIFVTVAQMSKSEGLRDILYNELANLTIFMRMLKYAVARQKMIKCFSVSNINIHNVLNKYLCLFIVFFSSSSSLLLLKHKVNIKKTQNKTKQLCAICLHCWILI